MVERAVREKKGEREGGKRNRRGREGREKVKGLRGRG
jgi:hypothetical protein